MICTASLVKITSPKYQVSYTLRRATNNFYHSHKRRKDSLKTRAVLLISSLSNLKYLGWPYRTYIKTAKNGDFREELVSENDFGTVLTTFCCYGLDAMASEAVQKIAADKKQYRKCSSSVIICWIGKIYLSGWFLGHLRRKLKKLLKFHRKKSNNWSMVSFIHNVSEITIWIGYNFKSKSKSTKSQATFLRKASFLNFKLQIIRSAQKHWSCTPVH